MIKLLIFITLVWLGFSNSNNSTYSDGTDYQGQLFKSLQKFGSQLFKIKDNITQEQLSNFNYGYLKGIGAVNSKNIYTECMLNYSNHANVIFDDFNSFINVVLQPNYQNIIRALDSAIKMYKYMDNQTIPELSLPTQCRPLLNATVNSIFSLTSGYLYNQTQFANNMKLKSLSIGILSISVYASINKTNFENLGASLGKIVKHLIYTPTTNNNKKINFLELPLKLKSYCIFTSLISISDEIPNMKESILDAVSAINISTFAMEEISKLFKIMSYESTNIMLTKISSKFSQCLESNLYNN